jgi:dephospho-CoA kinase
MMVLGLTGGIGMGKSTATKLLGERNVLVVDTDELARDVVRKGQPALDQVRSRFGPTVIDAQGELQRKELARIVFADPAARIDLEKILHPPIREAWRKQVERWKAEGHPIAVVVIPLLFETGAEKEVDKTICVACLEPTQRQRLRARSWTDEQIDQRNAAQWPVTKKLEAADFVIWTEGGLDVHAEQLDWILKMAKEQASRK